MNEMVEGGQTQQRRFGDRETEKEREDNILAADKYI